MTNKPQELKCPNCNNLIFFEISLLLGGEKFTCSKCKCSISLSASSSTVVKEAIDKYEELKIKKTYKLKN